MFFRCFRHVATYALGGLLELSWAAFWALLGSLLASLGPLGLPFVLFWGYLGPILSLLGPVLAPPAPLLGLSWAIFGLLVLLVAFCGSLGLSFKLPLAFLGLSSGSFGPLLGPFWPSCSFLLALQKAILGPLGPSSASQASSRVF